MRQAVPQARTAVAVAVVAVIVVAVAVVAVIVVAVAVVAVIVIVAVVRCVMVVMPVTRDSPVKVSPVAAPAFTHGAYSGTPAPLQPLSMYHP
ncbi:hypothetical protein ACFY00_26110 [Kitasatospora sp. NPDC001540]|uniref:hypothetical protein n=1 Tax=Kitasatospora sp. NPDC001540 TaxID=3364014 RepID=UPI0036A616EA